MSERRGLDEEKKKRASLQSGWKLISDWCTTGGTRSRVGLTGTVEGKMPRWRSGGGGA